MGLTLRLKKDAPAKKFFSEEQLRALQNSFELKFDPGTELVHFGPTAPFDKTKRWQEVDTVGAPVGQIKTFNGSIWA